MLLYVAFHDCTFGIPLTFRTVHNLFNLRKLQSQTKTTFAIIYELLFADDFALAAHTLQEAQTLLDHFAAASCRLGLCVSLKTRILAKARFGRPYCPINLILTLSPSLIDF